MNTPGNPSPFQYGSEPEAEAMSQRRDGRRIGSGLRLAKRRGANDAVAVSRDTGPFRAEDWSLAPNASGKPIGRNELLTRAPPLDNGVFEPLLGEVDMVHQDDLEVSPEFFRNIKDETEQAANRFLILVR